MGITLMVNVSVIPDGREGNVAYGTMNARSLIVAEEAIVKMENAFACRVLLANDVKMVNCILDRDPTLKHIMCKLNSNYWNLIFYFSGLS